MRPILSEGIINDKTNNTQLGKGLAMLSNEVICLNLFSDILSLLLTYAINYTRG